MTQASEDHKNDIAAIGDSLMALAEARGWCFEYDGLVKDVNSRLVVPLPEYVTSEHRLSQSAIDMHAQAVAERSTAELDFPDLVSVKRDKNRRAVRQKHAALERIDNLTAALETSRDINFRRLQEELGEAGIDKIMAWHEEIHAMIQRAGYSLP